MLGDGTTNADSFANLTKVAIAKGIQCTEITNYCFANLTKVAIAKVPRRMLGTWLGFANLTKVAIAKEVCKVIPMIIQEASLLGFWDVLLPLANLGRRF